MPVRTIKKNGVPIYYQAIVGTGGKGNSKSFAVSKYGERGALDAANLEASKMEAKYESVRPPMRGNSSGVAGLRFIYGRPEGGGIPVLYVVASWMDNGVPRSSKCSTDVHGLLPAIELMKKAREKGAGVTIPQSAAELNVLMRKAFDERSSKTK